MNKIMMAARFAVMAHEGQKRKYNNLPYVTHPARVAGRVSILGDATEEMICAAYLHDVIEDTKYTYEDLKSEFGHSVASYVDQLTNVSKRDYPNQNRAFRKQKDREHLMTASSSAKKIKMIDRIDNLNELHAAEAGFIRLYCDETEALMKAIGDVNSDLCYELNLARLSALASIKPSSNIA